MVDFNATGPPEMPYDWNDAVGWERYHAHLYPHGGYQEVRKPMRDPFRGDFPRYSQDLKAHGWNTVWVPGCSFSELPKYIACFGMKVYATDVSPTAIAFQHSQKDALKEALAKKKVARNADELLICETHDFRTPYRTGEIDLIVNVRAFQGFPRDTMRQVARTHYDALKPERQALFFTINVQDQARDRLEDCLSEAGFHVPYFALNRWYRERLRATGIPHVFILDDPKIPWVGEYATNEAKRENDTCILRSITTEYHEKLKSESTAEQARIDAASRYAHIIYNTG